MIVVWEEEYAHGPLHFAQTFTAPARLMVDSTQSTSVVSLAPTATHAIETG
ncbi:13789_t:CDS:2 [Acaulospora colombiana]|uniref:13789_t:CDS:1 n=1 Tax=Acaulospora colombiana TaxID=27376 RepID=A0ACA9NWS2_9GLOM|nr:13789_t:CDS:2 [Acaulospora colombiana]